MASSADLVKADIHYLQALRGEMETFYRSEDEQIDRGRDVRDLKRSVNLPEQYRLVDVEVRDPTIADETQRVVATLGVNPAALSVVGEETDAGQKNSSLRERWTEGVLKIAGGRMKGQLHTHESLIDGTVGDGGAWTKLLFTKDTWGGVDALNVDDFQDEYEDPPKGKRKKILKESKHAKYLKARDKAKKGAGVPFIWQSVDSRTLYPVWTGSGLQEVLEVTERPEHATFRRYRLGRDKRGNITHLDADGPDPRSMGEGMSKREAERHGSYGTIEFLEHWDDTMATYAVVGHNARGEATGQVVKQFAHGYRRVPYFPALINLRSYWRNRKIGWSVGEAKRWLVEYRSFLWTLHAQVCARDTLPPVFREVPADATGTMGDDGQVKAPEIWEPRQIINGRPGEKLVPFQFPAVAQALTQQIEMVDQAIEKLETPRVQSEIGGGLEGAGFAINQILVEARTRHAPICASIEACLGDITRFLWFLVREHVGEDVWVYVDSTTANKGWCKAGPDDLTDDVQIAWKLDPELPSAKLIEERYWAERVKNGSANLDQMITELGDSPDEVRFGRAIDRMRGTPWYQKFQDQAVLQELGKGDMLAQAAMAAQVAQTGQFPVEGPAGATPPAMGNSIVPDLGQAAMAPGGGGAAPMPPGPGGPPMPQPTIGPGVTAGAPGVPQQSAAAGAQGIMG